MSEELKLTQEWDKVFHKSEKINHKKVTFKNHFGIQNEIFNSKGEILMEGRKLNKDKIDHFYIEGYFNSQEIVIIKSIAISSKLV